MKRNEQCAPKVISFWVKDGVITDVLPAEAGYMFRDERTKRAILPTVQTLLRLTGASIVAVVTEAWFVKAKSADACKDLPPSKHPDRIEGLAINLYANDYATFCVCEIDRKKRMLNKGEVNFDGEIRGHMFPEPQTKH